MSQAVQSSETDIGSVVSSTRMARGLLVVKQREEFIVAVPVYAVSLRVVANKKLLSTSGSEADTGVLL